MADRKRTRFPLFFLFLLAVSALPILPFGAAPVRPIQGFAADDPKWVIPDELVIDLRDSIELPSILDLGSDFGIVLTGVPGEFNPGRIFTASIPSARLTSLLNQLRKDSRVEAVEPQRIFRIPEGVNISRPEREAGVARSDESKSWKPNDPRYDEQWNFGRIRMEEAWATTRGKGVTVAVIDTGVAYGDTARGKRAKDFKGTEFVPGYDFINKDPDPFDDHGHGTHVAGTIAETTNNGEGVAGIAFEAKIMPVKVLSAEGWGRMSDIAAGIRWAADHGARVINMSLGGPMPDSITENACKYANDRGVTIVCAAGNSGSEGVGFPAAYPQCIAVSALGPQGKLAPYSTWGSQIAISAPGGDKTQGADAGILQNTIYEGVDGYYSFQGTSMATPHVAGVAALIASLGVTEPTEVRSVLQKSANPRGPRDKYGAGELDAAAAVKQSGAERFDYYGRVWLTVGIWAVALLLPVSAACRGRRISAAIALTIGLFLPDVLTAFFGWGAMWSILGHSIVIPVFLLVCEAEEDNEARFYGLMALGTAFHVAWDLYHGTAPVLGALSWAAIPWLYSNAVIGLWAWVQSRRT